MMAQPSLAYYRLGVFRELARRPGIDFKVLYAEQPGVKNVQPEGFEAEFVPIRRVRLGGQELMWHPAHARAVKAERADVVCLPWNPYFVSVYPALAAARRRGVGSLVWGHGYSKNERGWRTRVRRGLARRADGVIFYNNLVRDRSVGDGWLAGERAFVALNSLDQGPIQAARAAWLAEPGRLAAFRREKGLEAGPNLIFVSRLLHENRADVLLEAAAVLAGEMPGLRVIVVGGGPAEGELKAQAERLGLGGRVVFTGPVYGEEAIAPYYLSSHAFVYPANIGLSILHAMGYGVPVVTSDNTATQNPEIEALRDGENGVLYPHLDAAALAGAIRGLVGDERRRAAMGEEARRTATEVFGVERMADGFEAAARFCQGLRG